MPASFHEIDSAIRAHFKTAFPALQTSPSVRVHYQNEAPLDPAPNPRADEYWGRFSVTSVRERSIQISSSSGAMLYEVDGLATVSIFGPSSMTNGVADIQAIASNVSKVFAQSNINRSVEDVVFGEIITRGPVADEGGYGVMITINTSFLAQYVTS